MDQKGTHTNTGSVAVRKTKLLLVLTIVSGIVFSPSVIPAEDPIVYSVYKSLDMGNSNDPPQKDYYVNVGSAQGISIGTILEVIRRAPTYDLTNQKLYKDVAFPIAKLKVIHVESSAAIARLDKMNPIDRTPAITPRAVMVGDLVRKLSQ